jgi:shikimate dehydrogenase
MPLDPLLSALGGVASNDLPARLPERVAFIVGANPSLGARSPKLWNAAFDECGLDGAMFPLDVTTDCLSRLIAILERDARVVGIAVAAPHKAEMARLMGDCLAPAAARCQSINLLSRDSAGAFEGSNTDGIAAIASLREIRPNFARSRILVLGCGGTGRAVISTLVGETASSHVTVAVRSVRQHEWLRSLGVAVSTEWLAGLDLSVFGVVINCTSVGWGAQANASLLSRDDLRRLPADGTVFDVVYQPDPTVLLRDAKALGLATLSGTRMNLLQAVIAFSLANRDVNAAIVGNAMSAAVQ